MNSGQTVRLRGLDGARREAGKRTDWLTRYAAVRSRTLALADGLSAEDMVVQSMEDASPGKWHLGHTTWFFERFILTDSQPGYAAFDADFNYLFNSYYEAAGPRQPRPQRGLLTRPPLARVQEYRDHVDAAMARLIRDADEATWITIAPLIELGFNHEEQHQELFVTDLLHAFSLSPLRPAWRPGAVAAPALAETSGWVHFPGGIRDIGHDGEGFAFDNEGPRHQVLLRPYALSSRLVTNGEWREFMADGGYERPEFWLSDGWACVRREDWQAPGYWEERDGEWLQMGLDGLQPVADEQAVTHVSYYEAEAYARWTGYRLPLEAEWEAAVAGANGARLDQVFDTSWQWTQSAYAAYPGFRVPEGAVGEYNGKFMVSQMVLRGSSRATPPGHSRPSYRNFFYPWQRWQFMGLRLARDL